MCERLPLDWEEMLRITGVGRSSSKGTDQFLELIQKYVADPESIEDERGLAGKLFKKGVPGKKKNSIAGRKSSHLITWMQFQEGMSLDEISQERDLRLATIQEHLLQAVREGYEVDWDRLIPRHREEQVLRTARELGTNRLKPIKKALSAEIDYFTIRMVMEKNGIPSA